MTIAQIIALLTAGPLGLLLLLHAVKAARNQGDFHILQGVLLFMCVVAILLAFLGAA